MERVTRRFLLGAGSASIALYALGRKAAAGEIEGQTAKDPSNMTKGEKKHVPKITVKPGDPAEVSVVVGEIVHPMEEEHHIMWIDIYLDGRKLSRTTLSPETMVPCVTVKLTPGKSGTLTVVEECNLHGIWKNCAEIKVG